MKTLTVFDAAGHPAHLAKLGAGTLEDPFRDEGLGVTTIESTLRVAELSTIGDYKQVTRKSTLLFDEAIGGGATSVYDSNNTGTLMSVSNSGDFVVRQTKVVHEYTAGNPQVFEATSVNLVSEPGVIKRVGYFRSAITTPFNTVLDGLFLEVNEVGAFLKVVKKGIEIFSVAQADWDDPMDGSGNSGVRLDLSKFQAFAGEFLFLGGTVARFGFVIGPTIVWAHTSYNSNVNIGTMVGSPNQPLRWEIRSTGGVGSLTHVCGKVGSSGVVRSQGVIRSHHMGTTHVNANAVGTSYALIGLKPNNIDFTLNVLSGSALALTSDSFLLEILLNPTIAGTFTYAPDVEHGHDTAIGDSAGSNTVTGGIILGAEYISKSSGGRLNLNTLLRPGSKITGEFDEVVLCVTPLTSNLDIVGSLAIKLNG